MKFYKELILQIIREGGALNFMAVEDALQEETEQKGVPSLMAKEIRTILDAYTDAGALQTQIVGERQYPVWHLALN